MVTELNERLKDILCNRRWFFDRRNQIKLKKKPGGHTLGSIRRFKGL